MALRGVVNLPAQLFLFGALFGIPASVSAEEGHHGHGHDQWHAEFYSKLMRPDTGNPVAIWRIAVRPKFGAAAIITK
jgi:hypothetical protein